MSVYRQVHVSFWQDAFVLDLTPEEKYFYVYLMTNSKTSQIGIYELPKRVIEMETGYNRETVEKLLQRFIDYEKILYNEPTREIFLLNWPKHNWNNSPKIVTRIEKELRNVKYLPFVTEYLTIVDAIKSEDVSIQYQYPMDTKRTKKEKEKKKDKEKEKESMSDSPNQDESPIPYSEIVDYLNKKCITRYRDSTAKTRTLIKARFAEKFTLDDFKQVIDKKSAEWLTDEKMNKFLRPETLFGTKFEGYLNEKEGATNAGNQRRNGATTGASYEDVLAAAERDRKAWGG